MEMCSSFSQVDGFRKSMLVLLGNKIMVHNFPIISTHLLPEEVDSMVVLIFQSPSFSIGINDAKPCIALGKTSYSL